MKRKQALAKILVVTLGVALVAGVTWLKLAAPITLELVQPRRDTVAAEVFGTGTLESKVVVGVGAKLVGKVVEVLVDQGETVTNGQTLARLEARDFADAVRVAEAKVAQMRAELAKASLDLDRSRELMSTKTISQAELDAATTEHNVAEARLENAEAELGVARARLADTEVVSPLAGLVITRDLEVGSTVVPGAPIFRVADTNLLWVHAQVDEREAGRLRPGLPVRVFFRCCPQQPRPGHVVRLHREADRVTEELEVDVTVESVPPNFFLGQKADVYIETARKADALLIPKSAVHHNRVLVVTHGRARWREIQTGLAGRETVEIAQGLSETDQIVAAPLAGKKPLRDGQRVALNPQPSTIPHSP